MMNASDKNIEEILDVIISNPKLLRKLAKALSEESILKKDTQYILEEIKRLREDHNRDMQLILTQIKEINEKFGTQLREIWTEIGKMWNEIKALREQHERDSEKMWNEIKALREQHERDMEKVWAELKALREDFNREMAELRGELITKMDALGARWGIKSERAFRNGIKGILESRFNVKVIKWIVNDETGLVFGEPTTVDADVVIRNSEHIMVEIKAHVSKSDVATLLRKAELYKKKKNSDLCRTHY